MKKIAALILAMTFVVGLSACSHQSNDAPNPTPEFFNAIGKTLSELKNEYSEGEFIESLNGFPDSAAACFGEPGAEICLLLFWRTER